MEQASFNDGSFQDKKVLHFALKRLGLRFAKNRPLIENFAEDKVIEIFDAQGTQLFTNFKFFETCGHTLLDLLVKSFSELYKCSTIHLEEYFSFFLKALNGKPSVLSPQNRKRYLVEEVGTGSRLSVSYESFWPLYDRDSEEIKGVMVVSRRDLLAASPNSQRFIPTQKGRRRDPHWLTQAVVGALVFDYGVKPLVELILDLIRHLSAFRRNSPAIKTELREVQNFVRNYLSSSRPFSVITPATFAYA